MSLISSKRVNTVDTGSIGRGTVLALVRTLNTASSFYIVTVSASTGLTDVVEESTNDTSCTLGRVGWVTDGAVKGSTSIALIGFG